MVITQSSDYLIPKNYSQLINAIYIYLYNIIQSSDSNRFNNKLSNCWFQPLWKIMDFVSWDMLGLWNSKPPTSDSSPIPLVLRASTPPWHRRSSRRCAPSWRDSFGGFAHHGNMLGFHSQKLEIQQKENLEISPISPAKMVSYCSSKRKMEISPVKMVSWQKNQRVFFGIRPTKIDPTVSRFLGTFR